MKFPREGVADRSTHSLGAVSNVLFRISTYGELSKLWSLFGSLL